MSALEAVITDLRERGYRVTRQRRAIVAEVLRARGHISAQGLYERVRPRVPGVNASTIYRTLELLEEAGLIRHSHLEHGAEYHRVGEADHVHLVCSTCGRAESLTTDEVAPLRRALSRHNGFTPDFTHFAIAGICRSCRRREETSGR